MECVWCLLLMGHLQGQNRNMLQLSGCGQRLTTVDDTASPRRPAYASTFDANEPGHVCEHDGGLHINLTVLKVAENRFESSRWTATLLQTGVVTSGKAGSFLKASYITPTRRAH